MFVDVRGCSWVFMGVVGPLEAFESSVVGSVMWL